VQIKARTGTTYTGDPEYADLVTYPARISYKPRRVLTATGLNGRHMPVTVAVEAGTRTSSSSPMAWSESAPDSPSLRRLRAVPPFQYRRMSKRKEN